MPLRLVDDTAYGAGWNGVAGLAPSQNAVYDAVEARAGLVTVADEGTDATSFPLFATAATGTLIGVKSNAGLTFNAATATLGVTGLTVTNDATINGLKVGKGLVGDSNSLVIGGGNALTTGTNITALGVSAAGGTTDGPFVTAVGFASLLGNVSGGYTVAVGSNAGRYLTNGTDALTTASSGVYLGAEARGGASATETNAIVIGASAIGLGSNSSVIGTSSSTVFRGWGTPTFGGTNSLTFSLASLTAARTATMPDASGTMTLLGNTSTGSGSVVLATSPTLVTPVLGTPTTGTLTNCTGYTFANIASKPTTLSGYGITDGQPLDATLTALAGLTIAANSLTIGTAADTFSQTTFAANTFPARASTGDLVAKTITDFALTILDDVDAATVRATIGAGTGSGDMVLASVQSVTGLKTFDTTKLAVKGSSTGTTAIASANASGTSYTATLQAATGTIAYTSDLGTVTVADEAADTTCFPLFATAATGSLLSIKSNAGLTFNAATATLGVTGLTVTNDATINGLTVGRGGGSISGNTVLGVSAFPVNTSGSGLVGIGFQAGLAADSASGCVFVGMLAGSSTVSHGLATAIGDRSFLNSTNPEYGVAIGCFAGRYLADGSTPFLGGEDGTYLGADTRGFSNSDRYSIVIGAHAAAENANGIVIGTSGNTTFRAYGTPTFSDGTDSTKKLTLSLSGITTGTTRTATMPDASGTMTLLGNTSTGSGSVVLATSPTLVTPTLGVATATSLACPTFTSATEFNFTPASANHLTLNTASLGQFRLSDSTVAHGMTSYTDTTVYGRISKLSGGTDGGLSIWGLSATDFGAIRFIGVMGSTTPTATGILFRTDKKNGTASQALAATEIVAQWANYTSPKITLLGSGATGFGTVSPSALIHAISTTEQLRLGYNATEWLGITVGATGTTTFDITTTGTALFAFSDPVDCTGSILSTSASGGVGYKTGAGGAVTQATSRTTGVTLNKVCGAITLVSAAGSASWQSFTVTNSTVAATDTVKVCQKAGTDLYMTHVTAVAAGSFRITFATTGGTTTEQPVFNFSVIKAVAA